MKNYLPSFLIIAFLSAIVYGTAVTTAPYAGSLQLTEQNVRDWDTILANFAQKVGDTFTGDLGVTTGNVLINTVAKGIQIKEGTSGRMGQTSLVAGVATVSMSGLTANSRIFLTNASNFGTAVGTLAVTSRANGLAFVVKSLTSTGGTASDASTVNYVLFEAL